MKDIAASVDIWQVTTLPQALQIFLKVEGGQDLTFVKRPKKY